MASIRSDLQRLGPLEKNMGVLLEKMEILDRVEQSLEKMGEKGIRIGIEVRGYLRRHKSINPSLTP